MGTSDAVSVIRSPRAVISRQPGPRSVPALWKVSDTAAVPGSGAVSRHSTRRVSSPAWPGRSLARLAETVSGTARPSTRTLLPCAADAQRRRAQSAMPSLWMSGLAWVAGISARSSTWSTRTCPRAATRPS